MIRISAKLLMALSAVSIFTLQGCGQVVRTEIQKGMLVKEQSTGKTVELERTPSIELVTPTTVKVFETVKFGQEFEQKFEKFQIQEKSRPTTEQIIAGEILRPLFTAIVFPIFMDSYWHWGLTDCTKELDKPHCITMGSERDLIQGEFVVEKSYKNFTNKKDTITSGFISVNINDVKKNDIAIGTDGITAIALESYFDTFSRGKDIQVEFKYKTATAKSVMMFSEAEKNVNALLPTYRKRGADNKSANDYIIAFKISNDPSDLNEARKFALTEKDKKEIERLFAKYDEALDLSRFKQAKQNGKLREFLAQYPNSRHVQEASDIIEESKFEQAKKSGKLQAFVKQNPDSKYVTEANNIIKKEKYERYVRQNCKGVVMDLREYILNSNIYADKGKCVSIKQCRLI